jgi:predicted NAD/FAD-binding protein
MNRILKTVVPVPTSEALGRRAGEVMADAGADATLRFDAIVVATAASRNADVLTDDLMTSSTSGPMRVAAS